MKGETGYGFIEKGAAGDIVELGMLYDALNDHLSENTNYAGWIKGVYPTAKTAEDAIGEGTLYVLRMDGAIAGSIILNHEPETAYEEAEWNIDADYDEIIVVHTLVVHPRFMRRGVSGRLMEFAREHAASSGMKAVRLDVSAGNIPAIRLYERSGYKYIGTVDLGLPYAHLKWFRLYELVI